MKDRGKPPVLSLLSDSGLFPNLLLGRRRYLFVCTMPRQRELNPGYRRKPYRMISALPYEITTFCRKVCD